MRVLPIVERELRVAVRQSRTWLWRVLTAALGLVVFLFVYWSAGKYSGLSTVGRQVFFTLTGFGVVYSLLAGPLSTADCLARERREGTLGLLFLTDLRSFDIVLGKMTAASLSLAVGAAAALPLFAAPVLLGGVRLVEFGVVVLALLNFMWLSLAVGVCASSRFQSGRAALGVTVLVLFVLTLGWIMIGEGLLRLNVGGKTAPYYYMFCPLYTIHCCFSWRSSAAWQYWLNMGAMQALAWACLAWACSRTRRSWQEGGAASRSWWRQHLERFRRGSRQSRLAWREHMLERNPMSWLEGRDRLHSRLLWGLCVAAAVFFAAKHLQSPLRWPDLDLLFLWPFWAHYTLCLWIAVQGPRRLADDRQSGALELVLCTPMPSNRIVRGVMTILRQRFGRAVAAVLTLDAFLAFAFCNARNWQHSPSPAVLLQWGLCAALVFVVQAYSFAYVGVYQGLARGSSLRATFILVGTLGLLPYGLFVAALLGYDYLRQPLLGLPMIKEWLVVSLWAGAHLLVCGVFLAYASRQLHHNFRLLAAQARSRGLLWRKTASWLRGKR